VLAHLSQARKHASECIAAIAGDNCKSIPRNGGFLAAGEPRELRSGGMEQK